MIDTSSLTKRYYSIGEVAEMFDVSKSLIRYWDSEFALLKPHKNNKGDRRFTPENIEQLDTIYHLVKERGFTLDGARKEIKVNRVKLAKKRMAIKSLQKLKKELLSLKNS